MNAEPAQMVPVSGWIGGRIAADDSAHRRIMTQPFGVVHILVSSEAAKHGLPKKPDKRMTPIRARVRVGQHLVGHRGQSERVVEFPVGVP